MCNQVTERYSVCRCIYRVHSVGPCPAVNHRDHGIQGREILVGTSCTRHSASEVSENNSMKYDHSATMDLAHEAIRATGFTDAMGKPLLRAQISKRMITAHAVDVQFIPAGDMHAVFTADAVRQVLKRYNLEHLFPEVFNYAKKIFGILVMIDRMDYLVQIVKAGLRDSDLPLATYDYLESNQPFSGFFSNFVEWDTETPGLFMNHQWKFLAPIFMDGEHQKLEDSATLPFIKIEPLGSGSYSKVYRIEIHGDHYNFNMPRFQDNMNVSINSKADSH